MDLSEFINQSYEKNIISKLEDIHKDGIKYYLTLWYRDGSVSPEDIKTFLLKYESNLHFKTKIVVDNKLKPNDFIWFDIINIRYANESDRIRFQHTYNREEDILNCLEEFHKCAKFCISEKPSKRVQKRNDNESSNYRKS